MGKKPVPCFEKHKNSYKDVYSRMYLNKPVPTITTRFNSFSNGRFGHPQEDRAISLREGALFQTFPNDYNFIGSMVTIAKQIGNAVPVKLSEIFGRHGLSALWADFNIYLISQSEKWDFLYHERKTKTISKMGRWKNSTIKRY
jgi:site-specific DNA-cytosine methylase